MALDIKIDDLTDGTVVDGEWTGEGTFDKLISAVNKNIELQYDKGRIKGPDYASVYLGAMQQVITESVSLLIQEPKAEAEILALRAKIEDENGKVIDNNGNLTSSAATDTIHHWAVKKAEQDASTAEHNKALTAEKVETEEANRHLVLGKLYQEYGISVTTVYNTPNDPSSGVAYYELDPVDNFNDMDINDLGSFIPKTMLGASMLKSRVEANVATKTADGYKADSYYKQFRSLQELMFALANAGIIDNESNSSYQRILESMEIAMNRQTQVWGDTSYVDLDNNSGEES